MIWLLPAESLPPWIEASPVTVFVLPPRDPSDDEEDDPNDEEEDEEEEPPVVREPDPEE